MKILRITSLGYEAGGTETGIALMNAALQTLRHEVKVLSSDARPEFEHFSDFECAALSHQPFILQIFYRLWYPPAYAAVRRALRVFKPDVVHVHTLAELSPSALFALRGCSAVLTVHGVEDYTSQVEWSFPPEFFKDTSHDVSALTPRGKLHYWYHRYLSRAVYHFALKHIDTFVALSKFMQRELTKDGIDAQYVSNFTKLFAYTPLEMHSKIILYVGRLEEVKGVQYLIEAMRSVRQAQPEATLIIAGEGSYTNHLKALAEPLGSAVQFVGHQTRDELEKFYQRAAVVVMPSVWPEAFGKIGIEAMSIGRPVVATNVGGIGEWLTKDVGFLVEPQSAPALAKPIVELLSNNELREKMSKAATEESKKFSIEQHLCAMLGLYEQVILRKKLRR